MTNAEMESKDSGLPSLGATKRLLAVLSLLCGVLLAWQSFTNSPTSDEDAQLVSGIATVRTGDPAYYRVNPPLHRIVSGFAVELCFSPELKGIYSASEMPSGSRLEFHFGKAVMAHHPDDYHLFFYVGRLVRIPFVLGAGWLLALGAGSALRFSFAIGAALWFTSPLVLGHGWTIMPDAFSGCAMILLLITTLAWLKAPSKIKWLAVGIAWGVALGTKFSFCPIYVVWPIGLWLHALATWNVSWRHMMQLFLLHVGHGFIALLVIIGIYGGADVGIPLSDHGFQSKRFLAIMGSKETTEPQQEYNWLDACPSPFPKQFLVGVDEQQCHVELGVPTYFSGKRYDDGIYWYYAAGLLVKEQLVFVLGIPFLVLGGCKFWRGGKSRSAAELTTSRERFACWILCLFASASIVALFSYHRRMALNIRYLFPALPLISVSYTHLTLPTICSV